MDKETLAAFYKSGATNFAAFKEAKLKREAGASSTTKKDRPRSPPTTGVYAIKDLAAAKPAPEPVPGMGDDPVKTYAKSAPEGKAAPETLRDTTKTSSPVAPSKDSFGTEAASAEYIAFLKQQQELQGCHKRLEDVLEELVRNRCEKQAELNKLRGQATDTLTALEAGTNWNLTSKYNVQQLIKDAQLKLQPRELYRPEMEPQYLDVVQQESNLQKLRQDHGSKELFAAFKAAVENGARRLERVHKEIKNSQLDATEMARLPDTLLIQLDHVLSAPTIHMILTDTEEKLEHLLFKLEETKEARARALEDGEMQLAEKKYYNTVEIYEEILELVLEKLATVEKARKDNEAFDKVRNQYQEKANDEVQRLKDVKEKLKQRCEQDLKKIFALKERVDAVEQQTAEKLTEERKKSDRLLADNALQLEVTWAKMEELERELERLEAERHAEFKRRVLDKDKDEHRRMEYEKFCQVVDHHAQLLDLTVRNCDTAIHCLTLTGEFVGSGFTTLAGQLKRDDKEHADLLLDTHKQHLEMFRGLYLSLGELAHKKDKRIEEIDRAIQQSHIQQELAAETLNPNAKKYSDAKKELLRIRDDVEQDLQDLKEKAQVSLNNFAVSEKALQEANIDFIHPVVEQQEEELELKTKMVEYKALAIGQVDTLPIKAELDTIKSQMLETKRMVESVNRSTMSTSLPLLKGSLSPASRSGMGSSFAP
eukprot:GGOE01003339.1.p1 GENE.GGOE01003339.1~~GGOE01003339.1.p1  ORF type:complete len:725 (+),score=351.05 GGOE01003339.1:51-2177(+)